MLDNWTDYDSLSITIHLTQIWFTTKLTCLHHKPHAMQDKASNPENTRYLAQKFHKDKRHKTTAHVVTSCDRKTRANQASTTRATTRRNIFRLPFSTLWPQAASHSLTTLELRQMMRFYCKFLTMYQRQQCRALRGTDINQSANSGRNCASLYM